MLLHGIFKAEFFDGLKDKKLQKVFVLEGRPHLESSRRACRELLKRKIQPTLIADNMAGFVLKKKLVNEIALACQENNKDSALCQVGSLILAVLGKRHDVAVRLYPTAVKQKVTGSAKDIFYFNKKRVAPAGIKAYVPLLEEVPQKYLR